MATTQRTEIMILGDGLSNVKADAINWTSVSNSGDESFDGTHQTNFGMENLAKWFAQNAEFLNVTLSKPFKPASDALHWWRSTASMSDKINDPNNGWKNHRFDAEKSKADPDYAKDGREAYAAFNKNQTQASYNALCVLNEQWWKGQVKGKDQPASKLYFGADAACSIGRQAD